MGTEESGSDGGTEGRTEEAGVIVAGETRLGAGTGAVSVPGKAGVEEVAGFRRSTETVVSLPCLSIVNVFADFRCTQKGPSYGGVNGLFTASIRKNTCEADSSRGHSREGGDPWWTTGIEEASRIEACRAREKSEADGGEEDGSEASMSPGRRRGAP